MSWFSLICDICNKNFEKKKSLSNHRRWHQLKEYTTFQEHHRKIQSENQKGDKNSDWKGDKISYVGVHVWIKKYKLKTEQCENCGITPNGFKTGRYRKKKNISLELANISGKYKRDVNDYEWLCRKCHNLKYKKSNIKKLYQEKISNVMV